MDTGDLGFNFSPAEDNEVVHLLHCSLCEKLWSVTYPLVLAAGLLGNAALSVAVAHLSHALRRPTRVILYVLAALDSTTLLLGFATRWPQAAIGTRADVLSLHTVLCKGFTFALHSASTGAVWTLVALAAERFDAVNNNNANRNCWYHVITKWRALFIALVVSVPIILTPSTRDLLQTELKHSTGGTDGSFLFQSKLEQLTSNASVIGSSNSSAETLKFWANASNLVDEPMRRLLSSRSSELTTEATPTLANTSKMAAWRTSSEEWEGVEQLRDHFTDAECVVGEETLGFWNVLDAFIYSALPATLLVLLDIFIVCRLHRALKARRMPESLCKDPQRRKSVATHLETLNHQQQQLQQIQQKQQQHCEHMLMTSSRGRIPNRNCHCFRGSEPILVAGERFKERLPNKEFIAPLDGRRSIQNIRDSSGVPSVSRHSTSTIPVDSIGTMSRPRSHTTTSGRATVSELHLTLLLLVPSIAFLVLTLPISAGHAVQMVIGEEKLFKLVVPEVLMILFAIAELLAYSQHALNFYLCILTSGSFRRTIRRCVTRSTAYMLLLDCAHRVHVMYIRRLCCCRKRARRTLPLIRFHWLPVSTHAEPNLRGAAACIQIDRRPASTSRPHSQCNAHRESRSLLNPSEQFFSSLSESTSYVLPPKFVATAATRTIGLFPTLNTATSPFSGPQSAQFECKCYCHNSLNRSSRRFYNVDDRASSLSGHLMCKHSSIASWEFNVCSTPDGALFPLNSYIMRNREDTI